MILPIIALMAAAFAVPDMTAVATTSPQFFRPPQTLEEYVRVYYKEDPILSEIARCESNFRHMNTKGEVLRGRVNNSDVGIMQINLYYHADPAKKLELDVMTLEGNLAYAQALYDKKGTGPWVSSAPCWKVK